MRGWKQTDLVMGEDLTLPDEFFEIPKTARERMQYCVYAGETETGILAEIQYKPMDDTPRSSWRICRFIDFASIYCGATKIYRQDKTQLRVERIRKTGYEKGV